MTMPPLADTLALRAACGRMVAISGSPTSEKPSAPAAYVVGLLFADNVGARCSARLVACPLRRFVAE